MVIGIIAVLASLLLAAVVLAIRHAEKAQARTEVKNIESAVRGYMSDFNRYPEAGACRLQSTGSGQTDVDLVNILRGINTNADANPRAQIYLDINEKSLGTNVPGGQLGFMYDPWGNPYQLAVDNQSVNRVVNADGETLIARTIAVWSWGPNKTTTPDPNDITHIRSWK